ncbi:ribonuclease H-like domain-containing protein [Lysobacter profundi]|uniref:ribonuclease H-like domain-containing protein n=1 Tax=Cognatiluteimonas profundi TaxID=2594501 RepID=UPI00131D66E5
MSVSLDKLRALRRQAGHAVPAPIENRPPAACDAQPVDPASPVSRARETVPEGRMRAAFPDATSLPAANDPLPAVDAIAALRRLLGVRERRPLATPPRIPVDRTLPGDEIAPGLRLIVSRIPIAAPQASLQLAFARREDHVDPRALLFFDTETTGLSGGTGTRAFMIGAADWHHDPLQGDGLRIRQLLITTLAAEPAMLRTFASWLAPHTVLSSYNGRCYDAPLLKTRYRLARLGDPIGGLDHVDLLFPTRRRYRGSWENCRLATIERELLRIVREDDLPGSEAPAAWLSYLRGGAARNLRRVAAHNHQDVVTLALLLLRLHAVHAADTPADGGVDATATDRA